MIKISVMVFLSLGSLLSKRLLFPNGCVYGVTQLCLTLCDLMDCSPPGVSVHGIFQARILEWVTIPFSGDLPDPGIEPRSPELSADSLLTELRGKPYINHMCNIICIF